VGCYGRDRGRWPPRLVGHAGEVGSLPLDSLPATRCYAGGWRERVAFALDCCDREAISFVATTSGITGEDVRDLMVAAVEHRFERAARAAMQLTAESVEHPGVQLVLLLEGRQIARRIAGHLIRIDLSRHIRAGYRWCRAVTSAETANSPTATAPETAANIS
jgi:transposase InsO family protein